MRSPKPHSLTTIEGIPDSFEAVSAQSMNYAKNLANHLMGASPDAEDIAQEAVIRAWRHFGTFEGRAKYSSWLGTIVRNCVYTQRIHAFRRLDNNISLEEFLEGQTDQEDPDNHLFIDTTFTEPGDEAQEDVKTALEALRLLPESDRELLWRRIVGEESHEQIAEEFGINQNTSKVRCFRAKRALRTMFTALIESADDGVHKINRVKKRPDYEESTDNTATEVDHGWLEGYQFDGVIPDLIHVDDNIWHQPNVGFVDKHGNEFIGVPRKLEMQFMAEHPEFQTF